MKGSKLKRGVKHFVEIGSVLYDEEQNYNKLSQLFVDSWVKNLKEANLYV